MDQQPITELEKIVSYKFRNEELLRESLRHSSFVNEQGDTNLRNNERLEFLGDAVINLIVGHILMIQYPDLREGDLSRIRASLVNEIQLAELARNIHLGDFIQLGKGELLSLGKEKNSILADAYEAFIAAVYLDGGFRAAKKIVSTQFHPFLDKTFITAPGQDQDYKSRLQEQLQSEHKPAPVYLIIAEHGPDHDKTFKVELNIDSITVFGTGKSKKSAEQDAARKGLALLEG